MSEHELLARSLARVARRLRLHRALQELTSGVCWLLGALVVYQILRALIDSPAVVSALRLLFILGGVGIAAIFVGRVRRKVTLAQAAGAADARANLNDELKTAYWFARRDTHSPLVSLQMQRASATAQRLDSRKLVSMVFPRGVMFALILALVGATLVWVSPRWAASKSSGLTNAVAAAASDFKQRRAAKTSEAAMDAAATNKTRADSPTRESRSGSRGEQTLRAREVNETGRAGSEKAKWTQLEEAARSAKESGDREAIDPPPKARDVQHPTRLADQAFTRAGPSAQPSTARSIANAANDLMSTLESVFDQLSDSTRGTLDGGGENPVEGAAEAKEKLDEAEGDNPAQHNVTEGAGNPSDGAAAPSSGHRQREAVQGQGQGVPAAGSADTQGSGMGEFATLTTTGGGGSPKANPAADIEGADSKPIEGERTRPLKVQSRRVKIDGATDNKAAGAADRFFAPTQWQQSELDYQTMAPKAHYAREEPMDGERVPLAYRTAVKEYFLTLRQKAK